MMRRYQSGLLCGWLLCALAVPALAQRSASLVRVFGYFQNTFTHQTENEVVEESTQPDQNSFSVQQLNVFLQKDLARNWTSLINIEMLNSYSSSRRWGALNLEEAWTRYRFGRRLNVKFGLHIPPFNSLNEIKNRTPLLPYIVRPLVYESSFNEAIPTEEYWPARAFGQVYGQVPLGRPVVDYSLYVGNSPNISSHFDNERQQRAQQTGVDTTQRVLLGGRVGVRYNELRAGVSATYDHVNFDADLADTLGQIGVMGFKPRLVPRMRLGGDFALHYWDFSLDSELIMVRYRDDVGAFDYNKTFYYATLGCFFNEELFGFVSYWYTDQNFLPLAESDIRVPNIGLTYNLHDTVYLKAHYAYVFIDEEGPFGAERDFTIHYLAAAVSVFF